MGCICSKSSAVEDSRESPKGRLSSKRSSDLRVRRVDSSVRDDGVRLTDKLDGADIKIMLIEKNVNDSVQLYNDGLKERTEKHEVSIVNHPGSGRVPNAKVGEQVAAGWPAWLASVAGEAIKGWLPLCAESFEKIDKIGQGTYSNVFKARDTVNNKIVALKKVRFDYIDAESVKFMTREIIILRRLNHPHIIKLEGLITSRTSSRLYLVFEYMEHDLTGLASRPGLKFTESQVKCYMQQLLNGLDHCHSHGVLHRDIKGSNLLIDNNGILKIADFGLASFYNANNSAPLTSRVVTLWYRPPELLLGASHYDVAVDLWSTGCILGELYAGKPILPGKTEVEQLHKIFRLCGSPSEDYWSNSKLPHSTVFKPLHPYKRCVAETFRQIPAAAVGLLEALLAVDPADRGTAALALRSEFFTTKPLACDPSSLPKYPPSKELDVKLMEDETRRRGASGGKGQRADLERKPHGVPLPVANAEIAMLMQKRRANALSTSRGEMHSSFRNGPTSSSFVMDNPNRAKKESSKDFSEHHQKRRMSHSGPLVPGNGYLRAKKESDDMLSGRLNLSSLSGLVATRTSMPDECSQEKHRSSQPYIVNQVGRSQNSFNGLESARKQDGKPHRHRVPESQQIVGGKISMQGQDAHSRGSKGNKMYVSGPLLGPSNNVDQMLKEHDRKIQEFSRRSRLDRTRLEKEERPVPVAVDRTFNSRGGGE